MKKALRFRNIIFMFLAAGGNIWGPGGSAMPELQRAISHNNLDNQHAYEKVMDLLFNSEPPCDVNEKGIYDNTALHCAASRGDCNIAQLLITAGANVNTANKLGMTPLHMAVQANKEDMVKLLLGNRADISIQNKNEKTPINLARENKKQTILDMLQKAQQPKASSSGSPRRRASRHTSPRINQVEMNHKLFTAAQEGNPNQIEQLIDQGAIVEARDDSGNTPLMLAVFNNNYEAASLLISTHNANIHIKNNKLSTPLHMAADNYNCEIVQLLLDNGADTDICEKNEDGQTPMDLAKKAPEEYSDVIAVLQKKLSERLFPAIKEGNIREIERLLNNGADIHAHNNAKQTPIDVVVECNYGNRKPVRKILNKWLMFYFAEKANFHQFKAYPSYFQRHFPDEDTINAPDINGNTLLTIVAANKTDAKQAAITTRELIVDYDANVNATNRDGDTALHIAVRTNNEKLTEELLENGADMLARNRNGETPMELARKRLKIWKMLREAQAKQASSSSPRRTSQNTPPVENPERFIERFRATSLK